MVPITAEELRSPYYKYFVRTMTAPEPEKLRAADTIYSRNEALLPEHMNRLFDGGYLPMEHGCSRLANGCIVLAALTDMPGVSPEMFDWWYVWHGQESMRFKIWNRDEHYSCRIHEAARSGDKMLSMKERCWDTVQEIEEDTGYGRERIIIHYRRPCDVGFDRAKCESFTGSIVCTGDESGPMLACHFLRPTESGSELRSRIWLGYGAENGRPAKLLPDGALIPMEPAKALLKHIIRDFTNLAALLPELYEQFGDKS